MSLGVLLISFQTSPVWMSLSRAGTPRHRPADGPLQRDLHRTDPGRLGDRVQALLPAGATPYCDVLHGVMVMV